MPPMANHTPRGRGSLRSRFKLNPAFAQAHGIVTQTTPPPPPPPPAAPTANDDETEKTTTTTINNKTEPKAPVVTAPSPVQHSPQAAAIPGLDQVKRAIARARTNGKLQVSDAGLKTPLPKMLFEFPALTADTMADHMSLDNPNQLKPWELHIPETLVLVDFSDNEGITEFPILPVMDPESQHTSDNSVERYRSVQIFRARRCNLQKFTITSSLQESWSQLLTLDLSGNKLTGEFALLHLPKTIRELDLSGNQLSSLKSSQDPSTSIDLPQLVSLDISMNAISSTGISPVMHVPCLQRINVGHNKIFNLNFILKSISSCEKSLTTLHAPKSLLSDLDGRQPIDLTNFLALLNVDLSENSLCCVPKIPLALQRLNVNENEIQTLQGLLDEHARGSSSLVVLQMQRNKLKSLDPATLVRLTQLNRLDLQFNAISSLPLELGDLTNLQQMFLEGNNLNSLRSAGIRGDLNDTKAILMRLRARKPDLHQHSQDGDETVSSMGSAGSGRSSKKSNGGGNHHTNTINVEVGGLLSTLLVGTKVLNYEGKHAHMLPFQLLEELKTSSPEIVQNIERFNVAKNQLHTIESDWFTLLPQLTILEAQDNRLTSLPANIRELALTQIGLSRNNLTSHAVQFSILMTSPKSNILTDALQTLDLSSNNLDTFAPELLRHFKSLRNLNLSRNRITSLKNIVDAPYPPLAPCLEHLNVSENRIEHLGGDELPLMLKIGCPKLQSLRLDNNELEMVPMTLGLLENLKVFDLRGNPQRMIRYDVLDKSTSDVLQYMRNRMTSKTKEKVRLKMEELRDASENSQSSDSLFPIAPTPTATTAPAPPPPPPPPPAVAAKKNEQPAVASPPVRAPRQPTYASPPQPQQQKQKKEVNKAPTPTTKRSSIKSPSATRAASSTTTPTRKSTATPTSKPSPAGAGSPSPQGPRTSRIPTPKSRQGLSPVTLSGNSPRRASATTTMKGNNNGNSGNNKASNKHVTSPLLEELEKSIEELATEFERPGLSEPKRYAIKKKLAMERSKRLREERRLKQERAHSGIY